MAKENSFDIQLSKVKVTLPNGKKLFAIQDLSIPYGSHVLIQGESGKGKTTFLHLIAGLFSSAEGAVQLGTDTVDMMTDDERCDLRMKMIGVIFQKLNLIDHLTVEENVSLVLQDQCVEKKSRIESAINRVNLKGKEKDRCSFLSLGEQQRVAVARVLAQAPKIILADEPTSSLDEKNSIFVLEALKDAAKDKTLIVVSHDRRISNYFDLVIKFEEFTG